MRSEWSIPEDRPATQPVVIADVRSSDESEVSQLSTVEGWILGDDKSIPVMTCVLLENIAHGLIYGGRYLYAWNNGSGGDAPQGQGMPELEILQECSIDFHIAKTPSRSKGRDIFYNIKLPYVGAFSGYDEEGLTRQARTIGPRQSGPPADVYVTLSPVWLTDLTERQREYIVFTALHLIVPDENRYMNPWKNTTVDIALDSAALEIYGPEMPDGLAVLHAAKRHVQTYLPGMTPAERLATLERLLQENGLQASRDGKIVNL